MCQGFPCSSVVKNLPASAGDIGSIPGSGRPLEKEVQPTPVFLPGKSHARRSLVGYSPWRQRVRHHLESQFSSVT